MYIGYKKCRNHKIVKLQITGENTERRGGVVDPDHALYWCRQAYVLSIHDRHGGPCDTAECYDDCPFDVVKYRVGEFVEAPEYDPDNPVGIWYVHTRKTAECYEDVPDDYTGMFQQYDQAGALEYRGTYVDGQPHGEFYVYTGGQLLQMYTLDRGVRSGVAREWNGDYLRSVCYYRNDTKHGFSTTYYPGGNPEILCRYLNGRLHGTYTQYHPNGIVWVETRYSDGKRIGRFHVYNPRTGNLKMKTKDLCAVQTYILKSK